jgi:hypothetical protein
MPYFKLAKAVPFRVADLAAAIESLRTGLSGRAAVSG